MDTLNLSKEIHLTLLTKATALKQREVRVNKSLFLKTINDRFLLVTINLN